MFIVIYIDYQNSLKQKYLVNTFAFFKNYSHCVAEEKEYLLKETYWIFLKNKNNRCKMTLFFIRFIVSYSYQCCILITPHAVLSK